MPIFFRISRFFWGDGIIGIIDFLEKKLEKSEAVVAFLVFLEPKNTCFVMLQRVVVLLTFDQFQERLLLARSVGRSSDHGAQWCDPSSGAR